jgi:flagellin
MKIMPQIINTNIASLTAQRNLNSSQSANGTALERLSSGLRINSAKDDAAGLAISTKFESQVKGLNVAIRNAGDGISLAQTAEGALGAMTENLQRIRELAVQSSNATNSDDDRVALQAEVKQLLAEVSRTAEETNFNGRNLLDGSFAGTFQIGANAGNTVEVKISELTAEKLGSSAQSGISALGTDNALENGDLSINDISITPSKSDDDTASFFGAESSAIAKVAAINRASDETGVKAMANENIVDGSEMTGAALTGKISLNGVEIDIQTSADTASSRAAVTEAINAYAQQTGVTAVDTGADATGVQLTADDGRNITVAFETVTSAATGLASGASFNSTTDVITGASTGTYEAGFTLIADGDVKEIVISGGNGTGNGDLANAGLISGTYEAGVAQVASSAVNVTAGASLPVTLGANSLLGEGFNGVSAGTAAFGTGKMGEVITVTSSDGQAITISTAAASTTNVQIQATTGFGADALASALNSIDGVEASAETKVKITASATAAATSTGTLNFYDAGASTGDVLGSVAFTTTSTLEDIAAAINALTTGNLVADYRSSAQTGTANGELVVTEVNGNTLMTRSTAAGIALSVDTYSDVAGTLGGAIALNAGNAGGTGGVVSVGYLKNTDVTSDDVTSVSIKSNLSDATTANFTSATLTGVFATTAFTTAATVNGTGAGNSQDISVTKNLEGLGDGDLVLNGVAISAADPLTDTASATQATDGTRIQTSIREASGIAVAAAINDVSAETGVSATVNETVVVGGDDTQVGANASSNYVVGDSGRMYINGVDLGVVTLIDDGAGSVDYGASRTAAIDLINAKSDQTGVTAEDNGVSITLRAGDGRNVSVAIDNDEANNEGYGTTFGATIGLSSAVDGIGEADIGVSTSSDVAGTRGFATEAATYETTYSTITLNSAKEISVESGTDGKDEVAALGLKEGTYGGGTDGQFLKDLDVSTFEGAQAAITAIDNALQTVSSQRAELGALQNRFESTSSNLQITSENLSAANSRIRDADFAAETAELSRTQVLQQAGISILAQANQRPQQVLSLLG